MRGKIGGGLFRGGGRGCKRGKGDGTGRRGVEVGRVVRKKGIGGG
jgi:hypothetical protein